MLSLVIAFSLFYFPLCIIFLISLTSFSCRLQASYISSIFMVDSFSFWLVYIRILVLFFRRSIFRKQSISFYFACLGLIGCSLFVFCTSNLFVLYIFFEFSLIPILYIIIKWGYYPDRFASSRIILVYTALFSFPLIILMFYYVSAGSLFIFRGRGF